MSTYTIHPREGHHGESTWTLQHPMVSVIGALAAAVVAGVLIGLLISSLSSGTPVASEHRAGGHATATRMAAEAATAGATATTHTVVGATTAGVRSPARSGFAVGRAAGAGSGFIVVESTRVNDDQGFPGRSLGAGHAPAASLFKAQATG